MLQDWIWDFCSKAIFLELQRHCLSLSFSLVIALEGQSDPMKREPHEAERKKALENNPAIHHNTILPHLRVNYSWSLNRVGLRGAKPPEQSEKQCNWPWILQGSRCCRTVIFAIGKVLTQVDPHHSNACHSRVSCVCHLLVTFKRLGFLKLGHWPHALEKNRPTTPLPSRNPILKQDSPLRRKRKRGDTAAEEWAGVYIKVLFLPNASPFSNILSQRQKKISILNKGEQLEPKSENSDLLLFLAQSKSLWFSLSVHTQPGPRPQRSPCIFFFYI